MTDDQPGIHGRVLENLLDGVIVVERGGVVTVFNAAAGCILGLEPADVVGRSFAEHFIAREGFEELSELILGAVAGEGETGRQVVHLDAGGTERALSVATSYLRSTVDGEAVPVALIAVFSDITELRELRETELRMAKAVEAQHAELQSAYRQIEERNQTLAAMLKKVQVARIMATVLVIGVFLGAGAYVWRPLELFTGSSDPSMVAEAEAGVADGVRTLTIEPRPIRETISLSGKLAPWRTVAVTVPVEGHIAAVHFQYGQEVQEGDLLVELDTTEAVRKHREAQVAYIEKLKEFQTVSNWESGPEMAEARRSFARARMALESQERRLRRTAFLLEQGLIAASEHEDAERQHQSQLLDFEAARDDFEASRAGGDQEALDKASLELSTAEEELAEIAERLGKSRVHAPLKGVVLATARGGGDPPRAGTPVREGEVLLSIGDFSRMAVSASVDEIDVVRIAAGQAVSVTGNAFRDLRLNGAVTHVSSQPDPRARGVSSFKVEVTLDPLDGDQRARLRAGMSSRMRIVVYQNDTALIVPLDAVERRGPGHVVRAIDPATREVKEREVEVGPTTMDSVEIVAGLSAGDEIVVPQY